ncbi:hypothetical protein MUP77_24025 [Candidatus Bathyarchaeota archaeon]|nr:hypothetical protein [Candidatus Bathyarchaeota archaeon]
MSQFRSRLLMLSLGRLKDGERIWFANLGEDNASLREQKPKLNSADYIIYETQVFQNLNQNRGKNFVLSLKFTVEFNRARYKDVPPIFQALSNKVTLHLHNYSRRNVKNIGAARTEKVSWAGADECTCQSR